MLTFKAMYKFLDEGVHAEVLDFPGVITCGTNLEEARRLLGAALVDMAETNLLEGEPLPRPDSACTDPDADLDGDARVSVEEAHAFMIASMNKSTPQLEDPDSQEDFHMPEY